ncbi:MAG: glycosyltransferase family 4 protein, partial [Bacteroidota bacterium]
MKILIVHNRYLQKGGEDTVVAAEKELLESYGHQVRICMFDNADIPGGALGKLKAMFLSISNATAKARVKAEIVDFGADVVHVHNTFYVASPAIYAAAKESGVPLIQTLHNYRLLCPSAFLYHDGALYLDSVHKVYPLKAIAKRVWEGSLLKTWSIVNITAFHKLKGTYRKFVDKYIVFSEFSKGVFADSSLHLQEEQLAIKPNFVPDPGEENLPRGEHYLFVGRLSPEKGISVLLEAATTSNFKVKILGDGPLRPMVEEAASQNANIEFLGRKSREEVMHHFRTCRALIFPSVWYEGMPMVIIEALAAGAPIITSDLGNPGSMVLDGVNGLKFEAGNSAQLVEQIESLQATAFLVSEVSQASRSL